MGNIGSGALRLAAGLLALAPVPAAYAEALPLSPATMPVLGTVDDRYQSYNIEMIQVMGGKWWAPYPKPSADGTAAPADTSGFGGAPKLYRPPADLADPRLRKLAAGLSPAYVRVSDTWANSVYFQDDDAAPAAPPAGFGAVITRRQWQGVVDFAKALDTKIVTSFSIAKGVRDEQGVWTPVEARKLLAFFKQAGSSIAAAEFFNEPNLGVVSGAPKDYTTEAYARDFEIFRRFLRQADPAIKLLAPGPVGETAPLPGLPPGLKSADILQAIGPDLDGVSYHFYGALSERCAKFGAALQTTREAALTPDWLRATTKVAQFYGDLRDRFEPGKPVWLTETGETACGGNPWAADFVDSFRYLNQLGALARQGVQVVLHNTLAGSDYGLIDDVTLAPRPNYWAALLWRRLMGSTVLDASAVAAPNLYAYAQCERGRRGGVTALLINADPTESRRVTLPVAARRYTLTAPDLFGTEIALNGTKLALTAQGDLPALAGQPIKAGTLRLAPRSITFLTLDGAANRSCRG